MAIETAGCSVRQQARQALKQKHPIRRTGTVAWRYTSTDSKAHEDSRCAHARRTYRLGPPSLVGAFPVLAPSPPSPARSTLAPMYIDMLALVGSNILDVLLQPDKAATEEASGQRGVGRTSVLCSPESTSALLVHFGT